jgi:hypothetical protein
MHMMTGPVLVTITPGVLHMASILLTNKEQLSAMPLKDKDNQGGT